MLHNSRVQTFPDRLSFNAESRGYKGTSVREKQSLLNGYAKRSREFLEGSYYLALVIPC